MTTYILQYFAHSWKNYQAADHTNVEFIQQSHARMVGRDLSHQHGSWRIVDSHGNIYSL